MVKTRRILSVLFILPILGCILGGAFYKWSSSKEWSKWQSLGTPPSKPVDVISAYPLIVFGSDGNNYTYTVNRWETTDETHPFNETQWDQEACEGVESPPIDNLVDSEVSCEAWGKGAMGYYYKEYALLQDGSVWEWKKSYSADGGMEIIIWPIIGSGIFIIIAIILILIFLFDDLLVSLKEKANATNN